MKYKIPAIIEYNNKTKIVSTKGNIVFNIQKDLGLLVGLELSNKKIKKNTNINDFYTYIELNSGNLKKIKELKDFITKNSIISGTDDNDGAVLHFSEGKGEMKEDKILFGCSCVGGISEHNFIISNFFNEDISIVFKMNYNGVNDEILLSPTQILELTIFLNGILIQNTDEI